MKGKERDGMNSSENKKGTFESKYNVRSSENRKGIKNRSLRARAKER